MTDAELHFLELIDLSRLLQAKQLSPVEVTKAQLGRIEALDGGLRSYNLVLKELALAQARRAEQEIGRGEIKGPLHGVPVAVKDLCWTKGEPTTGGMTIYRDFRPEEDGTAVRKLHEAGAVLLGKLRMTEGAFAEHHPDVPPPLNPWGADYWVGSSSSGSGVATAAGLCYGSLGTDTGGSIRFPSSFNGITGLKPTWGRVSRYGAFELAATLDHIGPMARSAADTAAMLTVIAGSDPKDPTASLAPVPNYLEGIERGLTGLRIGIDPDLNRNGVDAATIQALDAVIGVIRGLGGDLRQVNFPDPSHVVTDWLPHCGIETAVAHEATYPSRKNEYGPGLAALIEIGRGQSALDYQHMVLRRLDFRGRVQALFETIDLLIIPTTAVASPTVARMATLGEDADLLAAMLRFTCPFDMSGNPTLTLPCGFTEQGTPIGFQFVSGHMAEDLLCRAGYAYQGATDWHRHHPPLAS